MKRAIVRLWKAATYPNGPPFPPPYVPRRPASARPVVEEYDLVAMEIDPDTGRLRIARAPPGVVNGRTS